MTEDVRYLANKTGLHDELEGLLGKTRVRHTGGMAAKERKFWSRVELDTIMEVKEFYRKDLLLFGYSVEEYFKNLGLVNPLLDVQ